MCAVRRVRGPYRQTRMYSVESNGSQHRLWSCCLREIVIVFISIELIGYYHANIYFNKIHQQSKYTLIFIEYQETNQETSP